MDGLTLLQEAQTAGLAVRLAGDRLVVRGPRSAEAVVQRLLDHKAQVLAALAARSSAEPVVIRAAIAGDELRLHCPTTQVAQRIEAARGRLEDLLVGPGSAHDLDQTAGWVRRQDTNGRWGWERVNLTETDRWWAHPELLVDPPAPCETCGSLGLWQDALGRWRCQRCEVGVLQRGLDLAERAARLQANATWPPVIEKMPRGY